MNTELNQTQALNTLISAVQVATKRGAFELEETEGILKAVKVFTNASKAPAESSVEPKMDHSEDLAEEMKEVTS